jgi:cytoskeletal protein CcmA (bactofilin family)
MWKKTEEEPYRPATGATAPPTAHAPAPPRTAETRRSTGQAVIGESIRIEGDVRGDEDLLIEGEVEGKISLENHSVTVGRSGRIKADIHGRNINVDGKVQGNLFADEQVIVRESGEVRGNITAPRVSLEDGSKFKGAIDMEPRPPKSGVADKLGDRAAAGGPRAAGESGAAEAGAAGPGKTSGSGAAGAGTNSGSGTPAGAASGAAGAARANVSA